MKAQALFRERRLLAWSASVIAGLVLAAGAILVIGSTSEAADTPIKCSVYKSDGSIRLTFNGKVTADEAKDGCVRLAAKWSGPSAYWRVGIPPLPESEPQVDCALEPPGSVGTVFVETSPSASLTYATALCGELAHAGWTQATAPTGGPWVHEFRAAMLEKTLAEEREQALRNEEAAEREALELAQFECEEEAQEDEEAQLEAIERETQRRVEEAPESRQFEIESEGFDKEHRAYLRGYDALGACASVSGSEREETPGITEPNQETEFR